MLESEIGWLELFLLIFDALSITPHRWNHLYTSYCVSTVFIPTTKKPWLPWIVPFQGVIWCYYLWYIVHFCLYTSYQWNRKFLASRDYIIMTSADISNFLELSSTCHAIYLFTVYSWLAFNIFTELYNPDHIQV